MTRREKHSHFVYTEWEERIWKHNQKIKRARQGYYQHLDVTLIGSFDRKWIEDLEVNEENQHWVKKQTRAALEMGVGGGPPSRRNQPGVYLIT